VLLPNQKVVRQSNGTLEKETDVNAADARAWAEHRFVFTDRPLGEVFDEVARQYGVRILMPDSISGLYTGNFPKTDDVAQTLRLICRPFGFTFVEKQAHVYAIEVQ
jgi:ferric-dicitrate binding protein FerR (iron transport regulator)